MAQAAVSPLRGALMIVKMTRDGAGGPRVLWLAWRRGRSRWVRAQVGVEFKPQDVWVGAFWKVAEPRGPTAPEEWRCDVWVCVVPMLPVHVRVALR